MTTGSIETAGPTRPQSRIRPLANKGTRETTGARNLNPDELNDERRYSYPDDERAVLHALRGRRKKSKNSILH